MVMNQLLPALEGYGQMRRVGDYFGTDLEKKNISNISNRSGKTDSDLNIYRIVYYCLEYLVMRNWSTVWIILMVLEEIDIIKIANLESSLYVRVR